MLHIFSEHWLKYRLISLTLTSCPSPNLLIPLAASFPMWMLKSTVQPLELYFFVWLLKFCLETGTNEIINLKIHKAQHISKAFHLQCTTSIFQKQKQKQFRSETGNKCHFISFHSFLSIICLFCEFSACNK